MDNVSAILQDASEHNRAVEQATLDLWAERPDAFTAYYHFPEHRTGGVYRDAFIPTTRGAEITTWMGARLGAITLARVTTNNLGARILTVRVDGTNGARYHGRASWDHGTVITLRRMK